ncbi:MAG TPA: DNA polymerase III subunit gamma/tau [Gemmatimonadales bacterium]|nr:DNA polymerase III subunit gamma/tau [Gemmatimonadales bacterium]
MAIALARRYRPRRFADLLVQDHVAAALRGAIASGRLGHGYLLTGPRGVGKTTAARILAMALNCERRETVTPAGEPCGECDTCLRIWNGSANLDVVEIDAASNRGVDDARELRERAMYAASQEGHHKVYIVDEAHMLTREAWNALLKILEEPPPGVVFVFATTEPAKIFNTAAPVLSRLQRFDFRRIGPAAIRARLAQVLDAERLSADDDALTLIGRHADGGMRDALSVLDQCLSFGEGAVTAERVREVLGLVGDEQYAEVLRVVTERDPAGVFPLVGRLLDAGADLAEFLNGTGEMLRALMMLQVGVDPEDVTESMRATLGEYRDRLSDGDVLRMLRLLAESETAVRRSGNARLAVETLLLRWTLMDRTVDLAAVIAGGGPPQGATPAGRPSGGRKPGPGATPAGERAAPSAAQPPRQASPAGAGAPIPFELSALAGAWDTVVERGREKGSFLGAALAVSRPAGIDGKTLSIELTEENPMHREALERQAEAVEEILSVLTGSGIRMRVGAPATAARPERLTEAGARAERLTRVRKKDPALDVAANILDLEVLD